MIFFGNLHPIFDDFGTGFNVVFILLEFRGLLEFLGKISVVFILQLAVLACSPQIYAIWHTD